jgi:hypothetical protein
MSELGCAVWVWPLRSDGGEKTNENNRYFHLSPPREKSQEEFVRERGQKERDVIPVQDELSTSPLR